MRITIITAGSRGDVQPYVALGMGLQRRGHRVRIATYPGFREFVTNRNLEFFPFNGNPGEWMGSKEGRDWYNSGGRLFSFIHSLDRFFRRIKPLIAQSLIDSWNACQGADAIIASVFGVGGTHISEKLNIPCYFGSIYPISPTSVFPYFVVPPYMNFGRGYNLMTYKIADRIYWRLFGQALNEWRKNCLDLPLVSRAAHFQRFYNQPVLFGFSSTMLPKPKDWSESVHVTGYWSLDEPTGWHAPADLVDFLAAGPPPVCVGLANITPDDAERVARIVLKALADTNQRGILITGFHDISKIDLPRSVFATGEVPHTWLLPQTAAVVHHGGAGTTACALRAGVPCVVVPSFFDQPFWARRVYELGVAPKPIPRRALSAERLAAGIGAATSDYGMRARAAAIGARLRAEDGVGRAVEAFHRYI